MIAQVSGHVISIAENSITIQVGEFAYEILVPTSIVNSYRKKSHNGDKSSETADTFFTIHYLEGFGGRGNQFFRLVGFKREIEKEFFQLYTSVEGVGYRTALRSLVLPIQKIAIAIEKNDLVTLKKLPHIGSRTAEKMVATLKGRMQKFALDTANQPLTVHPELDFHSEVKQVLRQVGYSEQETALLIEKAIESNPKIKSAEELIQQIFQTQIQLK